MSSLTRTRPQLIVTEAVLLRPRPATASEHWPVLAAILDPQQANDPSAARLIDAVDRGTAPVHSDIRGSWSIQSEPVPLLRLSLRVGGQINFDGDVVLPVQRILDQMPFVTTARTIALTSRRGARELAPGTDLRSARRHLILVGPTPVADLRKLAQEQRASRELALGSLGRRHWITQLVTLPRVRRGVPPHPRRPGDRPGASPDRIAPLASRPGTARQSSG